MARCIIIDDEPWAIDLLKSYIAKVDWLELVYASENPLEALNYLAKEKADLVFLDIQMPELTGLQVLKLLDKNTKVIVTTAYTEYAIQGYEHDIIDYLLKPIEFGRFYKAVQKVKEQSIATPTPDTAAAIPPNASRHFIFIKTDGKLVKVNFSAITYIEGLKDYIAVHTTTGKLISLDSLINMEAVLPSSQFIRIHKSYIVNIEKIEVIEKNVMFIGAQTLPIGLNYREALLKLLQK
jgi:DNA-binding LytR/AlgR family response regulator